MAGRPAREDSAMIVKRTRRALKWPEPEPLPPPESGVGPVYTIPASAFSVEGLGEWYLAGGHSKYGKIGYIDGEIFVEDLVRGALFWIPASALSPEGFLDWAFSGQYPPYGKVEYIDGEIYIDMNAEALNTHAKVKLEITTRINNLVEQGNLGQVYPDRTLVVNKSGRLSNEPDASFCSWEALETGRVRETTRKGAIDVEKAVALNGAVEWVLEIISPDSIRKDTMRLMDRYFRGGVREYWLVDARGGKISFQVFSPGKSKFIAQRPRGGWVASPVFQRKFSLQRRDYKGFWRFELLVAPLSAKHK
jgi:Uma2 family endonuclease